VLGNAICDVGGAREVSRTGESKGGGAGGLASRQWTKWEKEWRPAQARV
jgi:hypothetical protein